MYFCFARMVFIHIKMVLFKCVNFQPIHLKTCPVFMLFTCKVQKCLLINCKTWFGTANITVNGEYIKAEP